MCGRMKDNGSLGEEIIIKGFDHTLKKTRVTECSRIDQEQKLANQKSGYVSALCYCYYSGQNHNIGKQEKVELVNSVDHRINSDCF